MKDKIYLKTLESALRENYLSTKDTILVVCAGNYDKEVFESLNFENVTISNLDSRMIGNEFLPYKWSFQDAENLKFPANHFDWVVVHAGLHHCYSPHKALVEMLRVGNKGIIVFESRDSLLMRIATKINLVPEYEIEAVIGNNLEFGGVANSKIPNHVYRWKENEVIKLVKTFLPLYKNNTIKFYYHLRIPYERLKASKSNVKITLASLLTIPVKIFAKIFPKQSNEFAFLVKKGDQLHEWLLYKDNTVKLNMNYLNSKFKLKNTLHSQR